MLEFIRQLVSERKIIVRVGETSSLNKQTDLGIPQVGVPSAMLFLMVIKTMIHLCRWSSNIHKKKPEHYNK